MTANLAQIPRRFRDSERDASPSELPLRLFVLVTGACGALALVGAVAALTRTTLNLWVVLLALLTLASSRFSIKVPGMPSTVSVSEIFVFTSILLFGAGPATLTVAVDGLWISWWQKDRRIYRTLFNIAEPAVSTYAAATVLFAVSRMASQPDGPSRPMLLLSVIAMTATYFLLNSVLQAAAVALENGGSVFATWAQHAFYLGINYYAAASLATLAVDRNVGVNLEVIGLVAPVLLLSYSAYKTAANRVEDAHQHIAEVEHLYQATIETLAVAVDAKDQVTHGHIRRVQRHTVALARALGVSDALDLKALQAASLLHDVGKLAVPDYVLNKPGALTPAEFERMKPHAAKGAEILTAVGFPYPVVPIVRHHHEWWNGGGYPDGLAGEAIPLGARIVTVVDCFDALTSDRPYRRRMTDEEAIAILQNRRGNMYDPLVVDQFIGLLPTLRREDHRLDDSQRVSEQPDDLAARAVRQAAPAADAAPARALDGATLGARIAEAWPLAEGCLFMRTGDGTDDVLTAVQATSSISTAIADLRVRLGEGLVGWVAAYRHTIVNSDPGLDLGDDAGRLGLGVCTAMPVFALGDLVGVLAVYLRRPSRFSEADVRRIGVLAQEIGIEWIANRRMPGVPSQTRASLVH